MERLLFWIIGITFLLYALNVFSYRYLKQKILQRQRWDLNICCGKTDGGGVNADIVQHRDLPNFVLITDPRHLPFEDKQFDTVLCSHTIEHVEDPEQVWRELQRIGRRVTLVVPPLWDVSAVFNLLEHRWIFLTMRKEHTQLPPHVPLPFARPLQHILGQRIHA